VTATAGTPAALDGQECALDLLKTIVRGLPNAEIGAEPYLAASTVKTTSPGSWPGSAYAIASKPSSSPTKQDSYTVGAARSAFLSATIDPPAADARS
jgi:hypothetical protein